MVSEPPYESLSNDEWATASDKEDRLKSLADEFERLLGQAETTAVLAKDAESKFLFWRGFWKLSLIILTGLIALINLLASAHPSWTFLPLMSATVAITLATLANIDSFLDYTRRSKENGDLFRNLRDASFRYVCFDAVYVKPMGTSYTAYRNAMAVNMDFCQIIEQARSSFKDQKYRQKDDTDKGVVGDGEKDAAA